MSKKGKQKSVMDMLRELLDQLEQLLKPGRLQPAPVPVRSRGRRS
jgi:hypothetical protein